MIADPLYYLSKVIPLLALYLYTVKQHLQAPTRWLYLQGALQKASRRFSFIN